MKKYLISSVFLVMCASVVYTIDTTIPPHILECYRNNMTTINKKYQIPMTMQLLIELIQKLETSKTIDMRILSNSMLYSAKFDGIQRVSNIQETENTVPVGPTSIHFTKFRMLLTYLLSGDKELFPKDVLSKAEFCTLHRLISSSVQGWERGDESFTCPQIRMIPNFRNYPSRTQGKIKSACPIEKGVVKTPWGDVASGILITAIGAALENQNVKLMNIVKKFETHENIVFLNLSKQNLTYNYDLEDNVNNLWASTLAGDLGEVIAYQQAFVTKLILGQGGVWNDSLVPRAYYLPDSIGNYWEMSLAETLAGIDGVIIGNSIHGWTKKLGRLRLSQVLDYYYSKKGIPFEENYLACRRKENIKKILENVNLVKETTGMAKLLQYYFLINPLQEWVPLSNELISEFAEVAVKEFLDSIDAVTDPYSACEKGYDIPAMDIIAVIDGAWTEYEGRRLIAALIHATDVSMYGSRMGLIKGNQGTWMTNFTHSMFQIFEDLSKDDLTWPTTLSLEASLKTIITFLDNKTNTECASKFISPRNTVILVISPLSTINSQDAENSKSLIKTIKAINPSFPVVYITSDLSYGSFEQLSKNEYNNDVVIKTQNTVEAIVDTISNKLKDIPGQIFQLYCRRDTLLYEDYITPKLTTRYEIPLKLVQDTSNEINVEFIGHEYGNLTICGSNVEYPENKLCKWMDERNSTVRFATKPFCQQEHACNVQFKVSVENSKNKCTDDECRFFNQARIQIKTWSSSSTILISNILIAILTLCTIFL